jgi:hypothetical protein
MAEAMTEDPIVNSHGTVSRAHDDPGRYPALLDALHAKLADGRLIVSPSGYILASAGLLADAAGSRPAHFGLACCPAAEVAADRRGDTRLTDRFCDGLLALHRAVLRHALQRALDHLNQRSSQGASLLSRPELQADLADIAIEILECAPSAGAGPPGRVAQWACHQRLTRAGRVLLRLFGASSMLCDGPGADLYLAELAGNVYLLPAVSVTHD